LEVAICESKKKGLLLSVAHDGVCGKFCWRIQFIFPISKSEHRLYATGSSVYREKRILDFAHFYLELSL
jgi:hypothetical protein